MLNDMFSLMKKLGYILTFVSKNAFFERITTDQMDQNFRFSEWFEPEKYNEVIYTLIQAEHYILLICWHACGDVL